MPCSVVNYILLTPTVAHNNGKCSTITHQLNIIIIIWGNCFFSFWLNNKSASSVWSYIVYHVLIITAECNSTISQSTTYNEDHMQMDMLRTNDWYCWAMRAKLERRSKWQRLCDPSSNTFLQSCVDQLPRPESLGQDGGSIGLRVTLQSSKSFRTRNSTNCDGAVAKSWTQCNASTYVKP